MKNGRTGVRRLVAIPALVFSIMIIACGCSASRTQSEPQQTAEAAKAKQPAKMQSGAKYVINIDRAPFTMIYDHIVRYHKVRVFGDTGKMMQYEISGTSSHGMLILHKSDIVTMETPGPVYSGVRLGTGVSGWVETENLTFLSE